MQENICSACIEQKKVVSRIYEEPLELNEKI